MKAQAGILPGVPRCARYLTFALKSDTPAQVSGELVAGFPVDESVVIGIGQPLVASWGGNLEALREFPALSGADAEAPSTQHALWCCLLGDDRGELVIRSNDIVTSLSEAFDLVQAIDGFKHGNEELGKDLTGYEDGTENPEGDDAVEAAFASDGSSFVAVQQWMHDLPHFFALPQTEQDLIIGRRKSDNEEIGDAPASAHTKRTDQESFEPHAFVLRRSMPFSDSTGNGLMFVAFGRTFDAFEVQLRNMLGLEDGVTDALFRFSRPVTGGYYWCPPVADGRLHIAV